MTSTVTAFRKAEAVKVFLDTTKEHLMLARTALAAGIARANEENDQGSDLGDLLGAFRTASVALEGELTTWEIRANFLRDRIIEARKEEADATDLAS